MLTARVVKLPKAQPAVNNFFPLFAFFFPGALLAARSENLGETRSAVNDFFRLAKKISSALAPSRLALRLLRPPGGHIPFPPGANCDYVPLRQKGQAFFFRKKLFLPERHVVRLFAGSPRPFRVVRVVRGRARAREKAAPRQARTVDAATRSRFSGGLPTAGLRRLRPCEYAPEAALSSGKTPAPFSKRDRHAIPASVEGGESTACCRPTPV